jgi:cysteine peptidase C11 family protein
MGTGTAAGKPARWVFLSYMVADPLQLPAAHADIVEMQRVGSSDDLKIAIQIQLTANADFRRFEIAPLPAGSKVAPLIPVRQPSGLNRVGSPTTLEQFLEWAHLTYGSDPEVRETRYVLVFWGHTFGFGFGRLGSGAAAPALASRGFIRSFLDSGGVSSPRAPLAADVEGVINEQLSINDDGELDTGEVRAALKSFRTLRKAKLEILGHNTCSTSKAETALTLGTEVHFLVASELGMPLFTGWPFEAVLGAIANKPGIEARDLATVMVDQFAKSYKPKTVALAALDLTQAEIVRDHITTLAATANDAINDQTKGQNNQTNGEMNLVAIATAFLDARAQALDVMPKEATEPAVDFYGLCSLIIEKIDPLISRANPLLQKVKDAAAAALKDRDTFVVANDVANAAVSPAGIAGTLRGFLVLAPDLLPGDRVEDSLQAWIKWPPGWKKTGWPRLLSAVSKLTNPT